MATRHHPNNYVTLSSLVYELTARRDHTCLAWLLILKKSLYDHEPPEGNIREAIQESDGEQPKLQS